MRLINADKFEVVGGKVPEGYDVDSYLAGNKEILEMIDKAPTVDAVEVVRCKNCMYSALLRDTDLKNESPWRYYHLGCRICMCNALIEDEPIIVEDDFFCKYGTKMN